MIGFMTSVCIPYICFSLRKKVLISELRKKPFQIWCRRCMIIPEFIGCTFLVYNGRVFVPVVISEGMVGRKLGEFANTRKLPKHSVQKRNG